MEDKYKIAYMGVLMAPHNGQDIEDFENNICLVNKACINMDRISDILSACIILLSVDGKNTKKMVKELLEELLEGIVR